jgi:DNA-binding GntR family transcriptional regulator
MVEAAWNITEPSQAMTRLSSGGRALLHEDHREMLDAFLARDAPALLAVSEAHQERLVAALSELPPDTNLSSG